mgnify:CR=1 FL=1
MSAVMNMKSSSSIITPNESNGIRFLLYGLAIIVIASFTFYFSFWNVKEEKKSEDKNSECKTNKANNIKMSNTKHSRNKKGSSISQSLSGASTDDEREKKNVNKKRL